MLSLCDNLKKIRLQYTCLSSKLIHYALWWACIWFKGSFKFLVKPAQFSLNNSTEQAHVFDASWSVVCTSKSYFVLASVFSAGSRQQEGNAITQMYILTLPNHGSIHYTNMGERSITLALCVWDACIMHSSRDIKVYHCYSGLVAACPACVTNYPICVSTDP